MNIGAYLREVLQENEEVIVQDLGTFQTSYASAEIHPVTHLFSPPNKNINFHTKTKASNLILEHYISQKESVPIEEAKEQVRNFVSNLKMNLGIEKRIALESLGELVLQVNDEIEFKQNKQTNILNDSFGLPEIYAKLVDNKDSASKSQPSPQSSTRKIQAPPKEEGKKAWGTIAAIGSLALVVVAVIYVVAIDSSLNPFNKLLSKKKEQPKKEEVKKDENTLADNQNTENNTQELPKEQNTTSENNTSQESTTTNTTTNENTTENKTLADNNTQTSVKQQETETKTTTETKQNQESKPQGDGMLVEARNNQFYIVIAGFGNQANAYKKARETKKMGLDNVKIIPPFDAKNLYRVAVGGYNSRPEADSKLEEIKNVLGVDAWILKY
ncbi:SPOR domain-containing protein [Raineya sp.]|jgi:cell division septation protein DedD/nucleoid DNA-binding protein